MNMQPKPSHKDAEPIKVLQQFIFVFCHAPESGAASALSDVMEGEEYLN